MLQAVKGTVEWKWEADKATGLAEAKASTACLWAAGTMGRKAVEWTWADTEEGQEAATLTSIKTLTVVVADLILGTATAK